MVHVGDDLVTTCLDEWRFENCVADYLDDGDGRFTCFKVECHFVVAGIGGRHVDCICGVSRNQDVHKRVR